MVAPVWPRTGRAAPTPRAGPARRAAPGPHPQDDLVDAQPGVVLELALVAIVPNGTTASRAGRAPPARPARAGGDGLGQAAAPDRDPAVGIIGDGAKTASLAPPPIRVRTRGCCTGLGQDQVGPKSTNSPWYSACSSTTAPPWRPGARGRRRGAGRVDAVVLGLGPVPAEADAQGDPTVGEMVERGHLLGQDDGVVLGGQQDAGAEADARGHGRRARQGDERVEAALVVVEPHAFDQRRRHVLADRQMRVLGHPERVEAELLDRQRPARRAPCRGR